MLKRASNRLLSKAPERYRPALKRTFVVLAAAFILFELWRLALALPMVMPYYRFAGDRVAEMAHMPPLIAAVSLAMTAILFFGPMALVVWGLWRLSRRGTKTG